MSRAKFKIVKLEEELYAVKKRVFFFFWVFLTLNNSPRVVWTTRTKRGATSFKNLLEAKAKKKNKDY